MRGEQVQDRLQVLDGALAREVPNLTECYRITEEDCYFMKVWLALHSGAVSFI